MLNLKDPAKRAEWVYGQPMAPCPKCGSYNMKPQIPIAMETTGDETAPQLVGKWARATKAGATPLQGPAYYACWDCFHKGPAVDCTGRTSEDCRADRALNAEMKRLWNAQTPNAQDEPRPGVALDPPVGRLVNEDKEATMDEILVCPECGSDQVTVTAEQSFMVNTGEHYCHSVKTYDDEAKARCLACQWTGHRGALVEDSKTPNAGGEARAEAQP